MHLMSFEPTTSPSTTGGNIIRASDSSHMEFTIAIDLGKNSLTNLQNTKIINIVKFQEILKDKGNNIMVFQDDWVQRKDF